MKAALPALLVLTSLFIFSNTLKGDFVYDDYYTVQSNDYIRDFAHVKDIFTKPSFWGDKKYSTVYRPVYTLATALIHRVSGPEPLGYHLFNVLLHAANALLIYFILLHLSGSAALAFFCGLVFSAHTLHTEAVSNITGGTEVLAALFFLCLLLFHFRYRELDAKAVLTTSLLYLLALLSKESAAAYPGVFLIAFFAERKKPFFLGNLLCLAAVSALYLFIRFKVFGTLHIFVSRAVTDNFIPDLPFLIAKLTCVKILGLYVLKFLSPIHLSPDYSSPVLTPFALDWPSMVLILIPVICVLLFIRVRDSLLRFGLLFFLITISIVSNLVFALPVPMAERFMYLPSLGLALALVRLVFFMPKNAPKYILAFYALFLAALTFNRNEDWRTSYNLWNATVESGIPSYRGLLNRADYLIDSTRYDQAYADLKRARAIYSGANPYLYFTLGKLFDKRNARDSSIYYFSKAIETYPDYFDALLYRGLSLSETGQSEKAVPDLKKALLLRAGAGEDCHALVNELILVNPVIKDSILADSSFRNILDRLK